MFFKIRPSLKHRCRRDTRFARKSIIYTVYYAALFPIMQTDAASFYNMIHVFNIICIHHIIIVVKVRPHSFTCSSHLALTPSRQRCMYKRYADDHCHVPTNSICIGLIVLSSGNDENAIAYIVVPARVSACAQSIRLQQSSNHVVGGSQRSRIPSRVQTCLLVVYTPKAQVGVVTRPHNI